MSWHDGLIISPNSLRNLDAIHKSLPHSTIIAGPLGIGTLAITRQLARSITSDTMTIGHDDQTIKVSDVRDISSYAKTKVASSRIIIIDDADRMTRSAQNAFLKMLEEPVSNAHFILTTHSPQSLLPTVRSRCQEVFLSPVDLAQTIKLIDSLGEISQSARSQISFVATGLPAEITRLSTDKSYLEQVSGDIDSVRTLLQGSLYDKIKLIQSYKDSRAKSIELLESSSLVIRRLLVSQPKTELVNKLEGMITASERIKLGGNVRLQLLHAATLN